MIQLVDVTKRFGALTALRNVSLEVQRGELVLLTGPSGAGKTTLLRTLLGEETPDSGQIFLAGHEITRLTRASIPYLRRNIGVVFQDFKLLARRSVLENVSLALEIRCLRRRLVRARALEALESVGLLSRADAPASVLSGGEQQRVAIARALVGEPAVILADEPTGNLDPEHSYNILDLLEGAAWRGATVLVATHDPMVVQNAPCDRLLLLDRGALIGAQIGGRSAFASHRLRVATAG